jgi:hypothetical protein
MDFAGHDRVTDHLKFGSWVSDRPHARLGDGGWRLSR